MSDKMELKEAELDSVVGGMMRFKGGSMTVVYTHSDGTVTTYPIINGNYNAAAARGNELYLTSMTEDEILRVLQSEGILGQQL